jgi:hypothetical protein
VTKAMEFIVSYIDWKKRRKTESKKKDERADR